jgi:altronate hydrolase
MSNAMTNAVSTGVTNARTIRLSAEDNVVVAVDAIAANMAVAGTTARERVPRGHKMAIAAIAPNSPVRKYGQVIGFVSRAIAPGEWVHEHNVALRDFARDYRFCEDAKNDELLPPELRATFEGYVRPNGRTARATTSAC